MPWPWIRARVEGLSMIPTLAPGETVWIRRGARIRPLDVVAARDPQGRLVVKRALQTCLVDEDGIPVPMRFGGGCLPFPPPGEWISAWWLLGDNHEASTDSRHYGWVPANRIVGRVVLPRRVAGDEFQEG